MIEHIAIKHIYYYLLSTKVSLLFLVVVLISRKRFRLTSFHLLVVVQQEHQIEPHLAG